MMRSCKKKLINRELSWLEFNSRVLSMAMDPSIPLLERLKFIGIVSSNFDEFFMVRIAILEEGEGSPRTSILQKTYELIEKKNRYFQTVLIPELAQEGIVRIAPQALNKEQKKNLRDFFRRELYPILTPIAISKTKPLPVLSNISLYIVISLIKQGRRGEKYAVIEVPKNIPRHVPVASEKGASFVCIEDIIGLFVQELFVGCKIKNQGLIRLTRAAEMNFEENRDDDFAIVMTRALQMRRQGKIIRLETSLSGSNLSFFKDRLDVSDDAIYKISTWFDLKCIALSLYPLHFPQLKYVAWIPQPIAELQNKADWWNLLKRKDICLHHPYDSFDPVIDFLNAAAQDPNVLTIKQTLYRTGHQSKIVAALEQAAKNGKQVVVVVELKARFEEEKNIQWAHQLEIAGATVLYGIMGLKTHAKVCIVARRESGKIQQYVHLSTGNYNEKTSQVYSDLGIITSNEEVVSDISLFFNMITGYFKPMQFNKLITSPYGLRGKLIRLIKRETLKGKSGSIIAKTNALVDLELIEYLYKASNAGVRIKLNVRGICCLRPGVPGMSENIEVVSIVDQFLEHSRIFYFANGGNEEIYLSSADWMPRNLDMRVEIMFLIENKEVKGALINLLKLYFQDNTNAWRLLPSGEYQKLKSGRSTKFRVQGFLCEQVLKRKNHEIKTLISEVMKPRSPKDSIS